MINYREVINTRAIFIKYLSPTNTRGHRIKFNDNYRKGENKTVRYNQDIFESIEEQAYNQLIESGFNIVARASTNKNFIFLVANWGEEYKYIKELINRDQLEKIENW